MGRFFVILALLGCTILFLHGCGGGSDSGSVSSAIENDTNSIAAPGNPGASDTDTTGEPVTPDTPYVGPPGVLGDLFDLGDLVEPQGDHWYYTKAAAINDNGVVIGQSNAGSPVKGAFMWDPARSEMTFLGIHSGTFDDYFNIGFEREDPRIPLIYSEAVDINNSGIMIGNSTTGKGWPNDNEKRAFIWKDGTAIDLSPPPYIVEEGDAFYTVTGRYSEAVDINEKGEVVLTMDDKWGRHAYYWDGASFTTVTLNYYYPDKESPTSLAVDVPMVSSLGRIVGQDSDAVAINENGQAVINSGGTAIFHDLNWDVIESLNHLPGATNTVAVDINDSAYTNNDGISDGHIVGNSGNGNLILGEDSTVQGFFWDGGAMYPVNHLGGGTSIVTDINNRDLVVGSATTSDGSVHAILWTLGADKKGLIQDLGTLGGLNSWATGINEEGLVVGYSETGDFYEEDGVVLPVRHAFLWKEGSMYDLGTHNNFYDYPFVPSYPFSEAVAVNAKGEVAGSSITINAHSRGFFLSPIFP